MMSSKAPSDEHQRITVIEPPTGWRMLDWKELWSYRELLWVLTARDIKVRYKQTVLGAGWAILRPVLTMLIFSLVFGTLVKMPSDGIPYPIFVYAALLPWTFFASAIGTASQSVVGSAQLVGKVYFPRLIIPLASIAAGILDLLISTAILLLLMAWYGIGWTPNLLLAPFMLMAVVLAALGVGTFLSAVTVAYRDVTHITPFLVQLWMYVTPVVFPVSIVPSSWQWLLYLNPLTGLIEGFRSAFLGRPLDGPAILVSLTMCLVFFVVAVSYFEKVERRFADII
jgi:lipopolysaccharide transport system permease protein